MKGKGDSADHEQEQHLAITKLLLQAKGCSMCFASMNSLDPIKIKSPCLKKPPIAFVVLQRENRGRQVKQLAQDHRLGNSRVGIFILGNLITTAMVIDYSFQNWAIKEEKGIKMY